MVNMNPNVDMIFWSITSRTTAFSTSEPVIEISNTHAHEFSWFVYARRKGIWVLRVWPGTLHAFVHEPEAYMRHSMI